MCSLPICGGDDQVDGFDGRLLGSGAVVSVAPVLWAFTVVPTAAGSCCAASVGASHACRCPWSHRLWQQLIGGGRGAGVVGCGVGDRASLGNLLEERLWALMEVCEVLCTRVLWEWAVALKVAAECAVMALAGMGLP